MSNSKMIAFLFVSTLGCLAHANSGPSTDDCEGKFKELAVKIGVNELIQNNLKFLNEFDLLNYRCDQYLDHLVTDVHESIHFSDYNAALYKTFPERREDINESIFSLLLPGGRRQGTVTIDLPEPKIVLNSYFAKFPQSDLLGQMTYSEFYQQYILSEVQSSYSISYGLASELNAYTHGLLAAQKIVDVLKPEEFLSLRECKKICVTSSINVG